MKRLWWATPIALWALVELRAGSSHQLSLPAEFNRVYDWHQYPSTGDMESLCVLSWNIHHGAELDTIAEGMRRHPADLYLLQEVDWNTSRAGEKNVGVELAQRLAMNIVFGIEFEELSQEHRGRAYTGQATLTRVPVLRTRVLRFERQSGFWQPRSWIPSSVPLMQRRIGNRMALVSELEWCRRKLVVYNVHLESRSAGFIQEHQLDEILEDAAQYGPDAAILLGGDLNTKYLPSIFLHKLEAAGFRSALGERIERTHRIAMALDWIFVRGRVRIENGTVARDVKGSDHYALWGVLRQR